MSAGSRPLVGAAASALIATTRVDSMTAPKPKMSPSSCSVILTMFGSDTCSVRRLPVALTLTALSANPTEDSDAKSACSSAASAAPSALPVVAAALSENWTVVTAPPTDTMSSEKSWSALSTRVASLVAAIVTDWGESWFVPKPSASPPCTVSRTMSAWLPTSLILPPSGCTLTWPAKPASVSAALSAVTRSSRRPPASPNGSPSAALPMVSSRFRVTDTSCATPLSRRISTLKV